MLTNSEGGPSLVAELFTDDWALRRFAGVSNLPAVPQALSPAELAPYTGRYTQQAVGPTGEPQTAQYELVADNGQLLATAGGVPLGRLAFYRRDYVLVLGPGGEQTFTRANFVRGAGGWVDWLRLGGRLARHEPSPAASQTAGPPPFDILRPWSVAMR